MRLSDYADYTLRVLMYCATHTDRLLTIAEMAEGLQVSRNHLMKIVNDLAHQGLLETLRGRGGGVRLMKPASAIRVGDVLRAAETDFRLVECFDSSADRCTLTPACRLRGALHGALRAFLAELDAVSLADIVGQAGPAGLRPAGLPSATAGQRRVPVPVAAAPAGGGRSPRSR